jgi:hypothetical protein
MGTKRESDVAAASFFIERSPCKLEEDQSLKAE